ncbi:pumilio homolog 1 [Sorghum bicolor]|uniref:pumilio homolog 1 n=1 Tax=Sorghum bicolor TaxID=4558 RepID=UPI000B424DE2|nr:pumilio homolog 1 [Sorghum bicolor]|eukprot:XP_021317862.1 pumilio homolog 1 [Sorghum bicolor]
MGHVLPLSHDMYGCRVIQKALDVGEHNQKIVIAKELKHKVLKCVRDQFASHVIQKCVECLPPKHIQFIFRSFCGRAKALSIHPYGSRVIQRVIEFANKLSADPFGNYVVQHLLEHGGQTQRSMIVRKFDRRVLSMCYHNVGKMRFARPSRTVDREPSHSVP